LTLLPTYPTICWASQRSQQIPGEVGARAESEYQRNQLEQESVMSKVLLEMSMSLDGYVVGPQVSPESPLARIHR